MFVNLNQHPQFYDQYKRIRKHVLNNKYFDSHMWQTHLDALYLPIYFNTYQEYDYCILFIYSLFY